MTGHRPKFATCRKPGFTLVELLVVIAIIGVLIALLLPAVQTARESARLTQCKNNLKQIGLATISYHDANQAFPPARLKGRMDYGENSCATTEPSWLVRIMPFLEESNAAANWDLYTTFDRHDDATREYVPATYICPTRRGAQQAVIPSSTVTQEVYYPCGCSSTQQVKLTGGAVGDYGGNHGDLALGGSGVTAYWRGGNGTGVIITSRPRCSGWRPSGWIDKVRIKHIVDGTSNTALVGEMHVPTDALASVPENGPMYNGDDLPAFARIGGIGVPIARGGDDRSVPVIGFGSWHPGVCPFVNADGSVQLVENFIDTSVLESMCRRYDAMDLGDPDTSLSGFFSAF
jgi:prepilin-type N-terminal cleavage/methylation domain-containing protein